MSCINKKIMYEYCCKEVISNRKIISWIIKEFVDEAIEYSKEEIEENIISISSDSLEDYIFFKDEVIRESGDICCYVELNEIIEVNIYLRSYCIENWKSDRQNKHKTYDLYFITGAINKVDGLIEQEYKKEINAFKKIIYISNKHSLRKECLYYKDILAFLQIILTHRFSAKHKIRLIKKYINDLDINGGLIRMSNLSDAIEFDIKERTTIKVKKEVTRQNNVRAVYNLMKNLNISLDNAMDLLGIAKSEMYYLKKYFKR